MGVHVEDGLPGGSAGVEHETELAVRVLVGDRARQSDHLGEQCGGAFGQLFGITSR